MHLTIYPTQMQLVVDSEPTDTAAVPRQPWYDRVLDFLVWLLSIDNPAHVELEDEEPFDLVETIPDQGP